MATPAANCGGGMMPNLFSGDHSQSGSSCLDDPNFATICSFIQNFGEIVRIGHVPFDELQQWLENTSEVPLPLVQLHLILLRRVFKTVSVDKWERSLTKFGHMYCSQDAWELERFGYKKAKIQTKLSILKNLLEAQFDFNVKFKAEVNKLQAADLRLTPLGRDTQGQLYWYQVDADANLRVYREDIDDETWEIVAATKDELVDLISQLQRGEVRKPEPEEGIILPEEDSNSKDALEPKEIILDTGKVEKEESSSTEDSNGSVEEKSEVKKVEPLLLRNIFSANKLQSNQLTIIDNNSKVSEEVCSDSVNESKPPIKLVFGLKTKPKAELTDEPSKHKPEQTSISKLDEIVQNLASTAENVAVAVHSVGNKPDNSSDKTSNLERVLEELKEHATFDKDVKPTLVEVKETSKPTVDSTSVKMVTSVDDILPTKMRDTLIKNEKSIDSDQDSHQVVEEEIVRKTVKEQSALQPEEAKRESKYEMVESTNLNNDVEEEIDIDESVNTSKSDSNPISNKDLEPVSIIKEKEETLSLNVTLEHSPSKLEEQILDNSKLIHVSGGEYKKESSAIQPSSELSNENNEEEDAATKGVEKVITKTEAYVCGEDKEIEEKITKEKTWICGEDKLSKQTPLPISPSTTRSNEVLPKDIISSSAKDEHKSDQSQGEDESAVASMIEISTSDCKIDSNIENSKAELSQQTCTTAKINSSLVSALYSESSESGSDHCDNIPETETNNAEIREKESVQEVDNQTKNISTECLNTEQHKNKELQKSKTETEPTRPVEDAVVQEQTALTLQKDKPESKPYVPETLKTSGNEDISKIVNESKTLVKNTTESASNVNKNQDLKANTESEHDIERCTKIVLNQADESTVHCSDISTNKDVPPEAKIEESSTLATVSESTQNDNKVSDTTEMISGKRKAEEDIESLPKVPRLDDSKAEDKTSTKPTATTFNPIVGETIEEDVMTIVGEGTGALNEGSNENSPVPLAAADVPGSQDESIESEEESRTTFPSSRGRGGRRGRGRRGRPAGIPRNTTPKQPSSQSSRGGGSRGLREVARLGVSMDSIEVNGENERPVRASRRIAQIRLKEEEGRRQLEEERLAQLKAAQIQKKAKLAENEKFQLKFSGGKPKKGRKSLKDHVQHANDYVPEESGSESEDNSDDEGSDEFSGKLGKKKKHRRRKNGKGPLKKGGRPWATSSEEDDEEAVEEEEEYHYEEEEEELVFKSDHEFSPESDLGEDGDAGPSRHARTAKQDKGNLFEEGNCCKCGKGDHPEWILLCDKCDKGWHASCLRPQLWVVPEGEWFCPPCQHNMLIENLNKNLVVYEDLLKKRENEILRKQRLAYVGISLANVLPDKEKQEEIEGVEPVEKQSHERKKPRRRILSDEELSDAFINDRSDDDASAISRSNSSEDSDEPTYRLRARRTKKAFNFKEYDDMINSALRVDDDEEGGEVEKEVYEEDEEDLDENQKLNGEEDSEDHVGGGKNEAYLKHLERQQAEKDDETDEELLDEKERLRRKELKKHGRQKKSRRRINDLEAYSEEEDSDDDFKASEAEDDEEELENDGESEWSGDKMEEDSDDSIAKRARRKERHGRLGRREKYSDKGLVRRSTRKRKSRISYDESDEDEEEEDQNDKWQSEEEEEEMTEESESNSDTDDDRWAKRKKKALPKSNFFSDAPAASTKGKGKGGIKRKKRKTDEDDVDRAWNSARGKKAKDEPVERRTRGRKINFKDILDSGESDDEGNVRPKRRPLSDSDDSRSPSSSRKLAEEIRAENARKEKEYEESLAKKHESANPSPEPESEREKKTPSLPESLAVAKLSESSENGVTLTPKLNTNLQVGPPFTNSSPSSVASSVISPHAPPSSSPVNNISIPSPMMTSPVSVSPVNLPRKSSPLHIPPPPLLVSTPPNMSSPPISSLLPRSLPPPPPVVVFSKTPPGIPFPLTASALGLPIGPPTKTVGGPPILPPIPIPVPVSTPEKKSKSKGSRGSRSSKSEKQSPISMEIDANLPKAVKSSPPPIPPALTKSSSKKREKEAAAAAVAASINVPNPALLMAGGGVSLPEMLAQGIGIIPSPVRPGAHTPTPGSNSSSKKSSSKGSSSRGSTNPAHQTTPPPVSQNLSPSLPIEIDRIPNPALFQGNPGMRPFHPMWARNPGPPPGYGSSGNPVPPNLGKPPINASPFVGQQAPPPRPGFSSPPPLRIPNPNSSPLQAFQHFKRDSPLGGPLYRLAAGNPQPLTSILPPGMIPPHAAGAERFFGPPSGYPHPYSLLPPHSQGHPPQPMFPYDYRPPEPPFKEEPPPPPRTSSSSLSVPVSSASSSPPPTSSSVVPVPIKEDGPSARDSEFGGLVSYFSSQRSEEDMDA